MSAFLIVHTTIKNPEKFQTYGASAGQTLAAHGAEILHKGKVAKVIVGEHNSQAVAIIKFPNLATIDTWYNSDEYQALIANRNEAADMTFIAYDKLPT